MSATNRGEDRYGRWTILAIVKRHGTKHAQCRCVCGISAVVRLDHLRSGASQSCGCLSSEVTAKRSTKHGQNRRGRRTAEYMAWAGARNRCNNPRNKLYRYYGGRGIKLVPRWQEFDRFLADMGPRPSQKHTLERIDNNGDYAPGNVVWASRKTQARNRRTTISFVLDGERRSLAEWAELKGLPSQREWARLMKLGWPIEEVLR
jgi:hypothetical protein